MAADAILLHIKDSFYFEVPKWMWQADYESHSEFPDVWVRLDPEFQMWQARGVHQELAQENTPGLPAIDDFLHDYEHWTHQGNNHGKPVGRYLAHLAEQTDDSGQLLHPWAETGQAIAKEQWTVQKYKSDETIDWAPRKIEGYNKALSGKILIPQPPGAELRNLYQKEAGFCVSKFMVIEVLVAILMALIFIAYAKRVSAGQVPRGRFWNLIDVFMNYLRNDVARANIHHGADQFIPILWTLFFFVLGCNLFGLVPWMGSPTGSISVTVPLATVVLLMGLAAGAKRFGPVGVWTNLVPHMELPTVIAVVIKPMMFVIELLGLFIRHAVLGVRLLANMVAGHVVLLAIMGMAITIQEQTLLLALPVGLIILVGSVLLGFLELFVAFLQAYIFALLSALFINSSTDSH